MAKFAELPDGTRLEFPDEMPDAKMDQIVGIHIRNSNQKPIDPTADMSGMDKFLAGTGKAFVDIGRGAGQMMGMVSEQEVADARERDKALMNTGAGMAGNITGNVAAAIPTAFIPGAATIPGGALVGAGLGALQPTTQGENRVVNSAIGGIAGAAVPAVMGGYRAAKAAIYDPLAGQNNILAGAVTRSVTPDKAKRVAQALRGEGARTPGVQLSAGEISQNEALSAMEDALRASTPGGSLANQSQANRTALANTLRGIGQDDTALQAAMQARDEVADPLYKAAYNSGINPQSLTPEAQANIANFQARLPEDVLNRARELAKLSGTNMDNESSIQGLHWIKKAIDSKIGTAMRSGDDEMVRAYMGLKNDLVDGLAQISPDYEAGRAAFQKMSAPISQMQVGQKLANTLIPATARENPAALNYSALARAMRNPDAVARQATGFEGAKMARIMSPEQSQAIGGVLDDSSRIAEALRRGSGTGSATARRLATSDFISQHFAENAPITAKIVELASKVPGISSATGMVGGRLNAQMAGKLDDMLANNPQEVARLIETELARMSAPERNQVLKMLPQSVMLALPSINSN